MRRFVVALLAILVPSALLAAAPAPSVLGTPVLLVYPFSVNGSAVTKEAGSRLAVTIATQIANLGGIQVKPAPPGTERQDYLSTAQREGADYYIAGYMTPLGDGVSVVEQLVSTQTGIVVYSNTAQVRTFEDVTGQGDVLREALLRHQTRNLGAYAAPPPAATNATPTPAPGSAAQANLGRLFSRRQKRVPTAAPSRSPAVARAPAPAAVVAATPAPTATPVVVAAAGRASGYGILTIGGPADGDLRSFTGAAIRNDMLARHQRVTAAGGNRETACNSNSFDVLLGGNISTRSHTILGQPQTTATLELVAYDCAGSTVYRQTFAHDARGGDPKNAVNAVVANAVAAFLHEPPRNPHS